MGMMLERDATAVDVASTDTYASLMGPDGTATTLPDVPAVRVPTVPVPKARPRRRTLHLFLRTIKGMFILAELSAAALLLCYSGKVTLLPASPPPAHVRSASAAVSTAPTSYCWLTPGHGICADGSAASTTHVPSVTARHGATLLVTVASPAPTSCAAAATNPADDTTPSVPLRAIAQTTRGSSSVAGYMVQVPLAPGTYLLSLACDWTGRPAMRWLDGQGTATYALSLHVTP